MLKTGALCVGPAVGLLATSGLLLLATTCWAAPAPLPERELEQGSDLIVEADVLSVSKGGRPDAPLWEAQLRIRKVLKGRAPSNPMLYRFLPPEPGLVGGRNESVFAGEHVRLYLFRDKNGEHSAWAPNSIDLLDHFPREKRILPTQWGETIYADGSRHAQQVPSSCCCACRRIRHRCRRCN